MATFSKQLLSGSTNGKEIKVVATGSPGTTVHTAIAGTAAFDEIWLYGYNSDTVSRLVTVQFGGTSTPDNDIKLTLPAQSGLTLLVPGLILQNSLVVAVYAAAANVVDIAGWVNRIQ